MDTEAETVKSTEAVEIPEPDYSDDALDDDDDVPLPSSVTCVSDNNTEHDSVQPKQEEVPAGQDVVDTGERSGEQKIPTPDYPEDVEDHTEDEQNNKPVPKTPALSVIIPADGGVATTSDDKTLISPKKLINPCLLSKEHKAMRQELKLNQKIGKNPTEKPELIKVLKERQEKEKKKEMEEHLKSKRTSLDIRLEEQAKKISQAEQQQNQALEKAKSEEERPEFFKIHSKIIKTKSDS